MDLRPNIDLSSVVPVHALTEEGKERLPFSTSFAVMISSMGDRCHMLAMDELGREAQYAAVDCSGSLSGPVAGLPMSYISGIKACAGELVVAGARIGDGRTTVLGLNNRGALQWEAEVPIIGTLARWPLPVCLNEQSLLVWETGITKSTLWMSEIRAGYCSPGIPFQFDDQTVQLNVIPAGQGLTLVRTHGIPVRMELLRFVDKQIQRRVSIDEVTEPQTPSLAILGDRYVLLCISQSGRQLIVQWFDWDFTPANLPQTLVSVSGTTRLHSAQFFHGGPSRLAINYRTLTVGHDWVLIEGNAVNPPRHEPKHTFEQFIGAFQWKQNKVQVFHLITPPTNDYDAGDWLESKLLLIHGGTDPVISIFQSLYKR